jgi:hypothetical protein
MCPSVRKTHCRKLQAFVPLLILAAATQTLLASETPKIVVRKSIPQQHRSELENKLRRITGWQDLLFSTDGVLIGISGRHDAGSQTARELLTKTNEGDRVVLLENATGRRDVAFCRVVRGALNGLTPSSHDVYVVLIDFDDFKQVSGDSQARASFDVGWAVLHEIDHVAEESLDPQDANGIGECEANINRMREELGLPLRTDYYFSFLPQRSDSGVISKFVRLGFQYRDVTGKTKHYWLLWDATLVGGLPLSVQTASLF